MSEASTVLRSPLTPVCAIGASAGGVPALRNFFGHIQTDIGLAYVVIVHLAPDHPSALVSILAACTRMPVQQVVDVAAIRPNTVYVIAPDRELVVGTDEIAARPFTQPRGQRAPIDMFFRSTAAGRGDGLAVILSGSGSDGALGVRAIKEGGGVVFVQEPAEAEFPMMPQNAIATGVADFVAPIELLTVRIAEVARSKDATRRMSADSAVHELRRITSLMRSRTGHDFSNYKRATVLRRVTRRMQVTRCASLTDYADYIGDTPEEAQQLFSDLLISVTMFFRDPQAFEALAEQVITRLFDDLGEGPRLRAWVVGCASGEEAYSLAILLLEECARRKVQCPIQIFASDLDEGALATAREGRYPRSIEADVSEERLRRWFVDEIAHYRVRQEVREIVLFANHSALKDPPFMRLDLITCRNLLIYLERPLQRQLGTLFHYGLKPQRFLFLGSAETLDASPELFAAVDRDARIYRARPSLTRGVPPLQLSSEEHRGGSAERRRQLWRDDHERGAVYMHMSALERVSPPSILVDDAHRIINLSPAAGTFLLHSGGPFSAELPAVVRPELRLDLKIALERAFGLKQSTLTLPTRVDFGGATRRVAMQVAPAFAEESAVPQALVFFMDGGEVQPLNEPLDAEPKPDELRRLHEELKLAHEQLSISRRAHEVSIEDIRAANEELQSINEEYRSTAEELETSKEELQSMNEELQTVNAELKSKLESISSAHSDLQNLTSATEIGTLFLDHELKIRMFTPPVAELFNITDSDVGRAITDFTHQMVYEGIERDGQQVLHDLVPVETVVESKRGRSYMMRVRPYRTIENRIEGIVVTFVDISARLVTERQLKLMVDELNHRVKNTLSIVQAIAHQTFKHGNLEHSARRAFEGRLAALAQAHNLLTLTHWEHAAMRDITTSIAMGCGAGLDRFTLDGPDIDLQAGQAVSIAMALHELCTNAVKYGALSIDAGRVLLQWRVLGESEPRLRIEWHELNGPPVHPPTHRGFGSLMVEQALADGIRGTAIIEFRPEGVTCSIEGPLNAANARISTVQRP